MIPRTPSDPLGFGRAGFLFWMGTSPGDGHTAASNTALLPAYCSLLIGVERMISSSFTERGGQDKRDCDLQITFPCAFNEMFDAIKLMKDLW